MIKLTKLIIYLLLKVIMRAMDYNYTKHINCSPNSNVRPCFPTNRAGTRNQQHHPTTEVLRVQLQRRASPATRTDSSIHRL